MQRGTKQGIGIWDSGFGTIMNHLKYYQVSTSTYEVFEVLCTPAHQVFVRGIICTRMYVVTISPSSSPRDPSHVTAVHPKFAPLSFSCVAERLGPPNQVVVASDLFFCSFLDVHNILVYEYNKYAAANTVGPRRTPSTPHTTSRSDTYYDAAAAPCTFMNTIKQH